MNLISSSLIWVHLPIVSDNIQKVHLIFGLQQQEWDFQVSQEDGMGLSDEVLFRGGGGR
jgi:hypothetical protein